MLLQAEEPVCGHEQAQQRHAGDNDLNHEGEPAVEGVPELGDLLAEPGDLLADLKLVCANIIKPSMQVVDALGKFGLAHVDFIIVLRARRGQRPCAGTGGRTVGPSSSAALQQTA